MRTSKYSCSNDNVLSGTYVTRGGNKEFLHSGVNKIALILLLS